MTYVQSWRGRHSHRYNLVDADTKIAYCSCGKTEDDKEVNKYHAKSTAYEGNVYHSAFEAGYAAELDIRMRAKNGDVESWERQVKIPLKVGGFFIANYYIDFVVKLRDGTYEWTELKGMETEMFRLKWRIFEGTFTDHRRTIDDKLLLIKQKNDWRAAIKRLPVDNKRR